MKKIIYCTILLSAALFLRPSCLFSADNISPAIVRVAIVEDRGSIHLHLKGRYAIYSGGAEKVLLAGPRLSANVIATKEGLKIGKRYLAVSVVRVKTDKDSDIYIDNRRFRGEIDIVKKDNGKLLVINHISVEDYLNGVLYHEVSHRWPMEILKAQAIAARTFALYQARQNKLQPYDLRSDIYSQVYGGRTSEKWSTNVAVKLTHDKVLAYNGDIFPAYFHATCAGHTEDASNLWNIDLPALKGVPCDFCADSKHYRWTKILPIRELEDKLRYSPDRIERISSVTILSKNKSGRAEKVEIKNDAGASVILSGKDFRQIVGPNELRSTKFDISVKDGNVIFNGFGWGHGVGMCQWGAFGMARAGKKANEILKHYYPGSEIVNVNTLAGKL